MKYFRLANSVALFVLLVPGAQSELIPCFWLNHFCRVSNDDSANITNYTLSLPATVRVGIGEKYTQKVAVTPGTGEPALTESEVVETSSPQIVDPTNGKGIDFATINIYKISGDNKSLVVEILGTKIGSQAVQLKVGASVLASFTLTVENAVSATATTYGFLSPVPEAQTALLYGKEFANSFQAIDVYISNDRPLTATTGKLAAEAAAQPPSIVVSPDGLQFGIQVADSKLVPPVGDPLHPQEFITEPDLLQLRHQFAGIGNASTITVSTIGPENIDFSKAKAFVAYLRGGDNVEGHGAMLSCLEKLLSDKLKFSGDNDASAFAGDLDRVLCGIIDFDWDKVEAFVHGRSTDAFYTKYRTLLRRLAYDSMGAVNPDITYYRYKNPSADEMKAAFEALSQQEAPVVAVKALSFLVALATTFTNSSFEAAKSVGAATKDLGLVTTGIIPAITSMFPDMTNTHRQNLLSLAFLGPVQLGPGASVHKHIFVPRSLLRYAFGNQRAYIRAVVPGTLTVKVSVVTSTSENSLDGPPATTASRN